MRRIDQGQSGLHRIWRVAMWGGAALLLVAPLVAMQLGDDVNWDRTDFATFGVMLLVACSAIEVNARFVKPPVARLAVGLAIVAAFFLAWAEMAVGLLPR